MDWFVSNPSFDLIHELDIDIDRAIDPVTQKRKRNQQHGESKWIHREGIKRSQRDIPVFSYEEIKEDTDELDQPKHCRYGANCILGQCNCMEEEWEQVPVHRWSQCYASKQPESSMKPGKFDIGAFVPALFSDERIGWKQNRSMMYEEIPRLEDANVELLKNTENKG